MSKHLLKRFSDEFVKSILEKYIQSQLSAKHCLSIFQIKKTRFFDLVKKFKTNPYFSISYKRKLPTNKLNPILEKIIFEELKKEKEIIIDNKDVPTNYYNYSAIKTEIERKHKKVTDESKPQFKQVLDDMNVKIIYALLPQAKGKVERSYRWLQDRIVRRSAGEYEKIQ